MMKKCDYITTTYEYKKGFYVDIQESKKENFIDVFLFHKNYMTKLYMFGFTLSQVQKDNTNLVELIKSNLENEDYLETYYNLYMDYDDCF